MNTLHIVGRLMMGLCGGSAVGLISWLVLDALKSEDDQR